MKALKHIFLLLFSAIGFLAITSLFYSTHHIVEVGFSSVSVLAGALFMVLVFSIIYGLIAYKLTESIVIPICYILIFSTVSLTFLYLTGINYKDWFLTLAYCALPPIVISTVCGLYKWSKSYENGRAKEEIKTPKAYFFIALVCLLVLIVVGVHSFSHKTYYKYNDKEILGKTAEEIIETYGEPTERDEYSLKYEIPVLSYVKSRNFYCIEFDKDGKAVEISTQAVDIE